VDQIESFHDALRGWMNYGMKRRGIEQDQELISPCLEEEPTGEYLDLSQRLENIPISGVFNQYW
jgi:hypothetical protein